MREIHKISARPQCLPDNVVQDQHYRITVLTQELIRLEYDPQGVFEDRATQVVLNRDFEETSFRLIRKPYGIEVRTSSLHLIYNETAFSKNGLSIQVLGNLSAYHSIWHYGEETGDLKGTARTLDFVDGETALEPGLVSVFGYGVLDDSRSLILTDDGWVQPRKQGIQDLYFFGYGHDYMKCLKDFYRLCGKTPMLPRYALGNWWSRYHAYTETSYLELMDRFERENIPFTVAVIDMDWHLVDIDPKYGSGWTGFTWNEELFPDPARFLSKLHDRGMRTTLNIHPADGIRGHEAMYEEMARALGVDYENEDPIVFDSSDPDFLDAYLKYAHHPHEELGVDFWWIDWQQGGNSKVEGLDPLWMLNHYHFLDSRRNGKRPMTFSRYAGPGSHRYPVGFSGDTITTWASLDFQPYFTANASNIGYGWWSHDLGGHMLGVKDDEMAGRWIQFGVYSPIMRLHSSNSVFNSKEPWQFKGEVREVMSKALRLRHRLMPYLYTMNYRSYKEDLPLVLPMYYRHPEEKEAYQVRNQYYFGESLIVAPVTTPRIRELNVAKTTVWIPEGDYFDFHTGIRYEGGRRLDLYRGLEQIPVLAKAGSIIPMVDEIAAQSVTVNPKHLRLIVFAGDKGQFTLYEDDNETCDYEEGDAAFTTYSFEEDCLRIGKVRGNQKLVPEKRAYTLEFRGCAGGEEKVKVTWEGSPVEAEVETAYDPFRHVKTVKLPMLSVEGDIVVNLGGRLKMAENDLVQQAFEFLNQAEIGFVQKEELFALIKSQKSKTVMLGQLKTMNLQEDLLGALTELITA